MAVLRWRMSGGGMVSLLGERRRENNLPCPILLEECRGLTVIRNAADYVLHVVSADGLTKCDPYIELLWPQDESYTDIMVVRITKTSWHLQVDFLEDGIVGFPEGHHVLEAARYIKWYWQEFLAGRPTRDFNHWNREEGLTTLAPSPLQAITDAIQRLIPPPPEVAGEGLPRPQSIIDENEAPRKMGGI